jgi:protein-disulfide isomerase
MPDNNDFEPCTNLQQFDSNIQEDINLAMHLTVTGTPASYINGYKVVGALPYENISSVIEDLLADQIPEQNYLLFEMPQITADDHVKGNPDASITILIFSDFQCPFCSRYANTLQQVLNQYPEDVKLVFKHFPLGFHQYAQQAAQAAECAGTQGKFWEMHDALFDLTASNNLNSQTINNALQNL